MIIIIIIIILNNISGKHKIQELRTPAILGTERILWKVLM